MEAKPPLKSKRCRKCRRRKLLTHFYRESTLRDHRSNSCKQCKNKAHRDWEAKHPEKRAARHRERNWRRLGLKLRFKQYDQLLRAQAGRCALCERLPEEVTGGRALAVDHCHETHTIRGLLCDPCNRALGLAHDNPDLLRRMAAYLERFDLPE